jgi:hypothetical protein
VRDIGPAYDRYGSFTTDAVEATRACMSAVARKRDKYQTVSVCPLCAHKPTYAVQQMWSLFDHLVGAGEERRRNFNVERAAVFRLTTSSNLVGCSTGRSAGLAPLRILSM